jgi:hypothetical protein
MAQLRPGSHSTPPRATECGRRSLGVRARRTRRYPRYAARAILLLALVLAIPIIAAANPIDPTWQSGWYDDGDTDQLVTQTMSPESMIGLVVMAFVCFSVSARLLSEAIRHSDVCLSREPVPRGPPQRLSRMNLSPPYHLPFSREVIPRAFHLPDLSHPISAFFCPWRAPPTMFTFLAWNFALPARQKS